MDGVVQVFVVHGGNTFRSEDDFLDYLKNKEVSIDDYPSWSSDYLKSALGDGFKVIKPRMPCKENARYIEWKVYFERFFPLLDDDVVLIGNSLGGIFLAKYLSENKFPKNIISLFLVAPPFDNSIPGEDLVGGFELGSDLSLLDDSANNLYLFFSSDDVVVPLDHAEKYSKKLKNANIIVFDGKNGHFNVSEFPEIVDFIKRDVEDYFSQH